jgi:hypothetical protein
MMFTGNVVTMVALAELAFPAKTLRFCDGGMVNWPAVGAFAAFDEDFGAIGSVEPVGESLGDEAPAGSMSILCPSAEAMVALADPEGQGAPIRFWIGEVDTTGTLIGDPELQFTGLVDTLRVGLDRGQFEVSLEYISQAERLFSVREGNVLSTRFHQLAWPGELGFDKCTGASVQVPWGINGQRGAVPLSQSLAAGGSTTFQAFIQALG